MSDSQQAERATGAWHYFAAPSDATSRFVPITDGRTARIDPPQEAPSHDAATPSSSEGPARRDEELLAQASQLVDHLRSQFSELHRRDQALASQLQQIESERRELQSWREDAERQLLDKEHALRQREAELSQQSLALHENGERMRAEQLEIARQRDLLDSERVRMIADVANQVAAERDRLQQAIATTIADRQRLQAEFEQRRGSLDESLKARQQELEAAKARVREDVTEEMLTAELRAERDAIRRDRVALELLSAEWIGQRERERAELDHEREIQDAATAQVRYDLISQRRSHVEQLDAERREQEAALQKAQEEFAKQRDQQTSELRHERAVLENRLRFQQEHLAKARQEIESLQNDFRRETQRTRGRLEESESVIRLRQSQLDRVRSLLEERERSVDREREMLLKSQEAFHQATEHDRERIREERDVWDRERSAQLADLRRQQDMLAMHSQNLDGRRDRLDKLRAELEETHRTTLEMRMAIEEAWAQLTQSCGSEVAEQRLAQAQQQLSGHYRGLREALVEQRRELDEMRQMFQSQRDEFRAEQQTLTEWATTQQRSLCEREADLQTQAEQLNVRESAWRSASQRWINEKIEAEAVIRDLLKQLTSLTEPASPVSMWPRPQLPIYE